MVRKLASTELTQLMGSHKVGLSPGRSFDLAVDFLSAALCNSYGAVRELITRLLLLDPATMATLQTDHNGSSLVRTQRMELGDKGSYGCRFRSSGGLEFRDVVPGILTHELHDLLEQGFLRGEQARYLVKREKV